MILSANISLIVYSDRDRQKVEHIIQKYSAASDFEDLTGGTREHYAFMIHMPYSPGLLGQVLNELNTIDDYIQDRPDFFGFRFDYTEEDYLNAPLFQIRSIGNKASLYVNIAAPQFENFCSICRRPKFIEQQKLAINLHALKKNPILSVDHFLVVSEKLAEIMDQAGLDGYALAEVEHTGKQKPETRGYQIVPTHILPPQRVPLRYKTDPYILSQTNRCPVCGLGGHLFPPFYYHPADVNTVCDFNLTYEHFSYHYVYRKTLVSKRVMDLLKTHKYIDKIAGPNAPIGNRDWAIEPVLLNADL